MSSVTLDASLHLLDQAMREIGFSRGWSSTGNINYTGDLVAHGNKYPVDVRVVDFELITSPKIYFKEHPGAESVLTPHILTNLEFCYTSDKTMTWLHHDDPIGKVVGSIQFAQQVLEDIITNKRDEDIITEFSAYWRGDFILLDVEDYGSQHLLSGNIQTRTENTHKYTFISDDLDRTCRLLGPASLSVKPVSIPTNIISLDTPLYPDINNWPPKKLGDFTAWLKSTDKDIWHKFTKLIVSKKFINNGNIIIVFSHQSMQFAIQVQLDNMLIGKFRPNEKFRKYMFETNAGININIKRYTPLRIDNNFLLTRGYKPHSALAGKKIVLIGCGTIGGYLAHLLVRSGAGNSGGELVLVDTDVLLPGNIGRHLLGIEFLFRPKVDALKDHLLRDMPLTSITPLNCKAQDITTLNKADLVIDATGDEALSMYLNNKRVDGGTPDILHTWIEGAGAAGRAFLAQSGAACLRCLNDKNNKPRYGLLKDDIDPFVPGTGCDDYFIPYPGSISAQTAGLAANLAIDWANKKANKRLRSLRFNYDVTMDRRPCNPKLLKGCPVCGTERG